MTRLFDSGLAVERQDVFDVLQVCRETALENMVGADLVELGQDQESSIHRHNRAETVIYILDGTAQVVIEDEVVPVKKGDRLHIGKGMFHGFRTGQETVSFLSVQSPPILDKSTGQLDLETRVG